MVYIPNFLRKLINDHNPYNLYSTDTLTEPFQMLKRASSVPSRSDCDENLPASDGQQPKPVPCSTIYQETNERAGITPSTTDESVKTSTTPPDPLLRQSAMASDNAARDLLPHLPNITPVRGHINFQGWL